MKLRPLQDRVIVKQSEAETKTASGIVLPDSAKEKPTKGKVIAVGPGKLDEKGKHMEMAVRAGDTDLLRQIQRHRHRSRWRKVRHPSRVGHSRRVGVMHWKSRFNDPTANQTGAIMAAKQMKFDSRRPGGDRQRAVAACRAPSRPRSARAAATSCCRNPTAARASPRTASPSPRRSNFPSRSKTWGPSS